MLEEDWNGLNPDGPLFVWEFRWDMHAASCFAVGRRSFIPNRSTSTFTELEPICMPRSRSTVGHLNFSFIHTTQVHETVRRVTHLDCGYILGS